MMNKLDLVKIGRVFFAIALLALGIEHFVFQDFIIGRAPAWPETIPGRLIWTYLSGALFVAIALAILFRKKARYGAMLAAIFVFLWALLRHIPIITASPLFSGEWTNAGKALRFVGGALAVAAILPEETAGGHPALQRVVNLKKEFIDAGRFFMAPTLIMNGIQHFMFTSFVASLIPEWFPGSALFWTWFGGVALIAGGTGLLLLRTAHLAALLTGIMVFSWFFIVHISREIDGVADGIAVFEALATAGTLFVIAGYLFKQKTIKRK